MAGDGGDLVGGAARLGQTSSRGLAQTVCDAALGQAGLADAHAHEIAQPLRAEGLAKGSLYDCPLAAAEQVLITSGSQDGLNLICRLLNTNDHPFYIENPCYQGAAFLFRSLGADLHPIPVDKNCMVVEKLPRDRAGVVFVTPSHQYPTGATLSLERRQQLLEWARETNSVLIEDDYDSYFRYDGRPIAALAGFDAHRRVFYLGTFSKSLGAGLRLGFTVVPSELANSARIVKS